MALSKNILVTGATGKQGSAVAQALLRRGQKVRALTRKPETACALAKAGAAVVRGDFDDRSSIESALRGCDGIFAMSTPFEAGMESEVRQGMLLADAAKAAGIGHFVYSSVVGADRGTGIPHFETKYRVEQHIKGLVLPYTILRPVWFMENFGTWLLPGIQKGTLTAPLWPQTRLHMISLRDIGEFAAAAFLHPERYLGREITLAGDALSFPEVAEMLAKALGHRVVFKSIPDAQAEKAVGPDMAKMFRWFNQEGCDVDIHALEQTYGIRLTKFAEVLANEAWAKPPLVGGRNP
ncbi:MAG: NmrA/HSCARG family protein [Elusimicrobia bacterium]|nr:NmrA/HSCARG family protein [Elusimicrobiota bacterium]